MLGGLSDWAADVVVFLLANLAIYDHMQRQSLMEEFGDRPSEFSEAALLEPQRSVDDGTGHIPAGENDIRVGKLAS
jgi:hypothetical protein